MPFIQHNSSALKNITVLIITSNYGVKIYSKEHKQDYITDKCACCSS